MCVAWLGKTHEKALGDTFRANLNLKMVFFGIGKDLYLETAVAVNFHQLYSQNQPQLPTIMGHYVFQVGLFFLLLTGWNHPQPTTRIIIHMFLFSFLRGVQCIAGAWPVGSKPLQIHVSDRCFCSAILQGSLNYPIWGDQTMQTYGHFTGNFRYKIYKLYMHCLGCLGWIFFLNDGPLVFTNIDMWHEEKLVTVTSFTTQISHWIPGKFSASSEGLMKVWRWPWLHIEISWNDRCSDDVPMLRNDELPFVPLQYSNLP